MVVQRRASATAAAEPTITIVFNAKDTGEAEATCPSGDKLRDVMLENKVREDWWAGVPCSLELFVGPVGCWRLP